MLHRKSSRSRLSRLHITQPGSRQTCLLRLPPVGHCAAATINGRFSNFGTAVSGAPNLLASTWRRVGKPVGQGALGKCATVPDADGFAVFRPDVLDRMPAATRQISTVAGTKLGDRHPLVGGEQGDPVATLDYVLPLVGIGVPVRLLDRSGLQLQEHRGHCRRHRKVTRGGDVDGATL